MEEYCEQFRSEGWKVWQMQFAWDHPEGFHTWFMLAGHEDIEVMTKSKEVQKTIVVFNK